MAEETTQPTTEATVVDETHGTTTTTSYLDGKYKSVSDLENGYKELQNNYTKKTMEYAERVKAFQGAPEEYDLGDLQISDTIKTWAKENQFSNDALKGLAETYQKDIQAQQEAYVKQEMKALGENANTRVKNATDWVNANLGDYADAINAMAVGAKGIEAIEKIMELSRGTTPANIDTRPSFDVDDIKAMRYAKDENGNRRMSIDPHYRAKVEKAEADFLARGGRLI